MSTVIGILLASTRPNRIGPKIADWVVALAPDGVTTELLDLQQIALPFLDEPKMPSAGDYVQPHTRAWAEMIKKLDAMIIVTCEYNRGYPAPLKNAIDFLYAEWENLPVGCVGYGWGGAGNAIAGLKTTLTRLRMRVFDPVHLTFKENLTPAGEVGVPNLAPEAEMRRLYADVIKGSQ